MTRSEAIRLLTNATSNKNWAECNVSMIDFFIKTGILKVEEEKTLEDKIRGAFAGRTIQGDLDLINLCNKYGLKIVEKDK